MGDNGNIFFTTVKFYQFANVRERNQKSKSANNWRLYQVHSYDYNSLKWIAKDKWCGFKISRCLPVKTPYNGIAKTALKCEPFRLVIKYKNVNIWRGGFSRSLRPCLSWRDRARHLSIVCAGAAELARSLAQRPGMEIA